MFITTNRNTMKTLKAKISLIVLLAVGIGSVAAQEYDDMYFTKKDRKKVKYVSEDKAVTQDLDQVQQFTDTPGENFSARTVNPEYIAKYQASSQESGSAEFANDEYFVEDYNQNNNNLNTTVNDFQNNYSDVAVRDRYGNVRYFNSYSDVYWSDPFLYQNTIFDPLYRPYYGWNAYRPWRSGWSVSVGFGWGWNSWRWNRWNTGWGWNSWNYGWGNAWGYDPWCPGFYGGYYGNPYRNVVVINNYENRYNRNYRRGPGTSRSGVINDADGRRSRVASTNNGRSTTTNGRTSSGTSRARYINNDNRDFDDAQSRYYRRSRSAVNGSSTATSSSRSTSRSSSNYTPDSRSYSNSRSAVSRSSSSNYNRSSYSQRSRSSRSSSSYNRSSNSSSRSSSYTPSRSSTRSRSSSVGSSSRSSRSSGVSSGSRSSSRSSGSRSSSRSSGSRRGN